MIEIGRNICGPCHTLKMVCLSPQKLMRLYSKAEISHIVLHATYVSFDMIYLLLQLTKYFTYLSH